MLVGVILNPDSVSGGADGLLDGLSSGAFGGDNSNPGDLFELREVPVPKHAHHDVLRNALLIEYTGRPILDVLRDALLILEVASELSGEEANVQLSMNHVYGFCPKCGKPGVSRERRLNGNDTCEAGHVYPSRDAARSD